MGTGSSACLNWDSVGVRHAQHSPGACKSPWICGEWGCVRHRPQFASQTGIPFWFWCCRITAFKFSFGPGLNCDGTLSNCCFSLARSFCFFLPHPRSNGTRQRGGGGCALRPVWLRVEQPMPSALSSCDLLPDRGRTDAQRGGGGGGLQFSASETTTLLIPCVTLGAHWRGAMEGFKQSTPGDRNWLIRPI